MRHACVSMTGIGSDDASHVYIKPVFYYYGYVLAVTYTI